MKKISILLVVVLVFGATIYGCSGQKTATEQMLSQTDDPFKIGRAAYLDALWAYEGAAKAFDTYRERLKMNNPELYLEMQNRLWGANEMLKDIKAYAYLGEPGKIDSDGFDGRIEAIAFLIADLIDERME